MSKRNRLKLNRMKYTAKRYIFSGRYIVRNALAVMIAATIIALVVVVLNLPGTKKDDPYAATGEIDEFAVDTAEPGTADPSVQKETLVLYEASMIEDIGTEHLSKVISEEQQIQMSAKDVQALANTKYNMDGKFLTEKDAVNIRAEADPDAEVLGRIYIGGTGEVLSVEGEWTKVSSGGVVGYVASDLILTDAEAAEKVENYRAVIAVIKDKVRVRTYGNAVSDVLFIARVGEFFTVDRSRSTDDWTCIRLADGSYAFVANEFVSLTEGFAEAISMEDIEDLKQDKEDYQALLEAEKKAQQEADEKARKDEEKRKAEANANAKSNADAAVNNAAQSTTATPTTSAPVTVRESTVTTTTDDLYLLAAIVYAEAGSECYDAQLAVANVVMNRVRSSYYPNTISAVIYQPYQFTACKTRNFARALSTGGSSQALRAAQEAMAGVNNVGGCIGFKFPNAVDKSKVSYCVQYGKILFFQ